MSVAAPPVPATAAPPTLDDLDGIAKIYPHTPDHFNIVRPQIEQRASLVKTWGIKPGEKVLEIGCGQGDCTVVLATAVGDEGSVIALDPASLDYGKSQTLAPTPCPHPRPYVSCTTATNRLTIHPRTSPSAPQSLARGVPHHLRPVRPRRLPRAHD